MGKRTSLTALEVKNAKAGKHHDGRGLILVVKPSGSRSWILRITIDGKTRDHGLGSASIYSLAEVRERAEFLRKELTTKRTPAKFHIVQPDAKPKTKRQKTVDFYNSRAWKSLRFDVLKASEGRCNLCGCKASDTVVLHVDHIKPRSKFPQLALEKSNLQVLCGDCNMGKGARDQTDWREPAPTSGEGV